VKIVSESKEILEDTKRIFGQMSQKDISWVDCYSVAIMRHFGITEILTFDPHFKKLLVN
jgi:predicted nucleic acid-binding protein